MESVNHALLDISFEEAHFQSSESSHNEPDDSELLFSRNSLLSLFDEEEEISTTDVNQFHWMTWDSYVTFWRF